MKRFYSILTAIMLLLSIMLSISSCSFLNGADDKQDNDTLDTDGSGSTQQNPGNQDSTESNGSTDDKNNNGGGTDSGDGGGSTEDDKTQGDENGNKDTEEGDKPNEPEFVPDMTKLNTIEPSSLPFIDYAYVSQNSYNKELFYKNSYEIPLGDPSVFVQEENGTTYFYVTGTTTGSSFEMWKTPNFTDWEKLGTIYTPNDAFFGKSSFWAPQLTYDENADWSYYLGENAGEGKGLYILFFSARKSNNVCALSVAFSKNVEGPYKNFVGVNANGDYVDESNTLFDIEKLKGLGLYSDHVYGDLYKAKRSFIDASPFVDPKTGDKYLYMVRSRNVDTSNDVWGVKMKDWVTPDYSTTTPLTSYGYTDIEKSEVYGYLAAESNKIDEGPFLYYKDNSDDGVENGKYYLTFSIGGTSDKLYPVCQAIGDSPLGPFIKVQPGDMGLLGCPEMHWDIHGCGHHAFFETDGELYIAYHTYQIKSDNTIGRRYFAFDKIEWIYNENGQYLMRSNGPTRSINPLPGSVSGYVNLAPEASLNINGTDILTEHVLTDGIIATKQGDEEMLFSFTGKGEITLSFENYVTARAIMFYNSYDFNTALSKVDKIELSYRKEIDGKVYFGVATINSLIFNFTNNMISKSYLEYAGETKLYQLRPAGSLIAEFDEIEINSVKIYLNHTGSDTYEAFSEIIILGKHSDRVIADETLGYGGYTSKAAFETYTGFDGTMEKKENDPEDSVTVDGILSEPFWTECATLTVIDGSAIDASTKEPVDVELYGERSAKIYTYVGKRNLYFAFDVTDKNLFFNASQPQGRSTCVELYFTTEENTTFSDGCYSIRINPTGDVGAASVNLGIYVPNNAGNEWKYITLANVVKAVCVVNGRVQTTASDTEYDSSQNVGYTIEIAIDKILIGLSETSVRFTAAFVQDRGYDEPRIANSFIPGTHYVKPNTWIVFTNKDSDSDEQQ